MNTDSETLRSAAKQLRQALDPKKTLHRDYTRLMLDLAWPIALARWLEAAAGVVERDPEWSLLDDVCDLDFTRSAALDTARAILAAHKFVAQLNEVRR